jgi:hypothetical protein
MKGTLKYVILLHNVRTLSTNERLEELEEELKNIVK